MKPAGRLSAAIEVLDAILARHQPAATALADWGKAHRFAGSGDRNAIGSLVYDALRRRLSVGYRMGGDSPRLLALGAAAEAWVIPPAEIVALCDGSQHAPAVLVAEELARLVDGTLEGAADHIRADIPAWLYPALVERFADKAIAQGEALSRRAPLDMRVNTLKAPPEKVLRALEGLGGRTMALSPYGIRIAPPAGSARMPNVEVEAGFQKGLFEIQDEASQLVALIAAAAAPAGAQVLDYCAGGGGKTLALAAAKGNKGQVHAYDADRVRLAPIYERVKRAGSHNVQVHDPRRGGLAGLEGKMDLVVVDAPCSGTGVWRRKPDSKWRLTPAQLEKRIGEQRAILAEAALYVKPGGRLAYVTCSLLLAENEAQIAEFLAARPDFRALPIAPLLADVVPADRLAVTAAATSLLLTPAEHGTDGFFIAVMERSPGEALAMPA